MICEDLSIEGSTFYESPNIDRIAKKYALLKAMQLAKFAVHRAILTGKHTPRHGITDWIGDPSGEAWQNLKRLTKLLPVDYKHDLEMMR